MLSTGLEPMTLALSKPRATNCAKRAVSVEGVLKNHILCVWCGIGFTREAS